VTVVRMLVSISGTRNGADWPPRGGLLELPDDEAASMVMSGLAEVAARGAVRVETATGDESDVAVAADVAKPSARGARRNGGTA